MSVATLISGPDLQMCLLSSVHVITIVRAGVGLHVWAGAVPGYIGRFSRLVKCSVTVNRSHR